MCEAPLSQVPSCSGFDQAGVLIADAEPQPEEPAEISSPPPALHDPGDERLLAILVACTCSISSPLGSIAWQHCQPLLIHGWHTYWMTPGCMSDVCVGKTQQHEPRIR